MKKLFAVLALAALAVAPARAATDDPVIDLANVLSGTWIGSTPGNELRLDLQSVTTDPSHLFDFFLSVSGKFNGGTVRRQGVLRLESQGQGVYVGFLPKFDPTVTALSPNAVVFTQAEAEAACGYNMKREGDGFAGDTLGSSCAIAMPGATGPWSVQIEPGSIRLQSKKSGETLRFKLAEKRERTAKK
ncbi:MAG TPA: hypothetical protein VIA29_05625 [Thermoanaerobaculia bacterium]|jgi:hypothetical protein